MILGGEEMEVKRKMELFDKRFVYLEWNDKLKGKEVFLGDTLPQLRDLVGGNYNSLSTVSKNVCDDTYYPFMSSSGMQHAMAYYDPNYSCKRAYIQGKTIQTRNSNAHWDWADCQLEPQWKDGFEYRVKPEPEMWTACIDDEGIISIMPAHEWNKNKGRQLIVGTEEKCKDYAVENYCKKCVHEVSICYSPQLGCQGFKELKAVKKRRMTNRELAKWVAQGNGEWTDKSKDPFQIHCFIHQNTYSYEHDMDGEPVKEGYVIRGWDETEWHEPEAEE